MLRVGYMDYANVHPIFYYLLKDEKLSFIHGYPSQLNELMRKCEVDISPASSIEFAKNYDRYSILSSTSISSLGAVKSVCLFSKFPLNELKGKIISLTKQSNTSIILLQIILEQFYNLNCIYLNDANTSENEIAAELLIGDDALDRYYHTGAPYIIDLGIEWYKNTGLPFVFALWLINKNVLSDDYLHSLLKKISLHANMKVKNSSHIGDKYLERYTEAELNDYWKTIDYSFSDKHIEGLLLFYKYAYELGQIKLEPQIAEYTLKSSLVNI